MNIGANIKASLSLSGAVATITTIVSQVATSPPYNIQTISFQADPTNSGFIYLGFSDAILSTTAPRVLAAGDAIDFDIVEDFNSFYALASSGSQTLRWIFSVR
jgi:hypothetical protein